MSYNAGQNGLMRVKTVVKALVLLSMTVFISGCLSIRPPAEVKYTAGTVAESLSSNVSLAYTAPGRSISGSGFLLYRKPGQVRVVMLSPFGSVLQEVFVSGDLVTIIDAGNGIAFSGSYLDLPDKGNFSGWRYIHWLIDVDPPDSSRRTGVFERTNRFGQPEKVAFENGMLMSKMTAAGGHVSYGRYTAVNGAVFPLEINYETAAKEKFNIQLEEPEINVPVAAGAFTPDLNKIHVYPLSSLR